VTVKRNRLLILASGLVLVLAMTFIVAAEHLALAQAAPKEPVFDPNNFLSPEETAANPNPFFPLIPGTTYYYEGESEGVPTSNVVSVTRDTKVILGVETIVVHDRAYEDGVLVEETFDWFAQDKDGNVWYLGEDSTEFPSGSKEGSWEAGVDGAEPGIIMEANPQVGDRYYQEFYRGVAEDQAKVLALDAQLDECIPYGCFGKLLQTKEWTQLEPGVVEHKYYAAGVGFIYGEMVKGGEEYTELVKITGPGKN
jgi:hypothetical protein